MARLCPVGTRIAIFTDLRAPAMASGRGAFTEVSSRDARKTGHVTRSLATAGRGRTGTRPPRETTMSSITASNDSFPRFLVRFQARDGEAAREIFRRFTTQLIALTRRRFAPAFRHKVDPEDVVQSAYKSFFGRYGEGNLDVGNWDGLWGLLTLITMRKCAERVAYHRAQCRDAAREVSAPPT